MTPDILDAIRAVHKMLSSIPDIEISLEDLSLIAPIIKIEKYSKGEFFIRPGESSQKAALALSGLVKTYYILEDGKEHITHFGAEGSFVGVYTDMLKKIPSTGYIETLEPCTFIVMDYEELLATTKNSLPWTHLLRIIAQSRYVNRSETHRYLTTQNANDRYEIFLENHPDLVNRIPQNQIALYLNITPATLSRLKNGSGIYKK
jgi:CRP-like cAMP-binding protein